MSAVSRRQAILATAVGAAGALVPTGAAWAAKAPRDLLTRSRFAAELTQAFTMTSGKDSWTAVLSSVGDLQPGAGAANERRFLLTFASAEGARGDGTYRLSRPGFTATDLFCVGGAGSGGYTAVVNRL